MTQLDTKQQILVGKARQAMVRRDWPELLSLIDNEGLAVDEPLTRLGGTLAHAAAGMNQLEFIKQLHARGAKLHDVHDNDGQDPIHEASKNGHIDVVRFLVEQGADIDDAGPKNANPKPYIHGIQNAETPRIPPLHWAAKRADVGMTQALLEMGANPDVRDLKGDTALMAGMSRSLQRSTRQVASLLVAYGADVDAVNTAKRSVVMRATVSSNLANTEMLLDMGAKLENPNTSEPLSWWCKRHSINAEVADRFLRGRKGIVQIEAEHIRQKQELFTPNAQGYAPLDDATNWQKLPQIAEALQAAGQPLTKADFLQKTESGKDYMVRAVECGGYAQLSAVLAQVGEPLTGKDFVEPERPSQPNALGMMAEDTWLGKTIFSKPEHWQNHTADEVKTFCRDLPQGLRDQFENYHQILMAKRQQEITPGQSLGR